MMRTFGEATLSPAETKRWTRIGVLAAFAMALGYLETFAPIPIPGVKLGLANIAILIALALGDIPGAFCIGVVKVLAAGLLFGNPLTMAFSAAGTLAAFVAMAPLSRLRTLRLEMLSVAGALAHELGQLVVAMLVLGTPLVWYSAPVLMVAGCITGLACGVIAWHTVPLLNAGKGAGEHAAQPGTTPASPFPPVRDGGINPKAAIAVFLLYCLAMLHAAKPVALAAGLALAGIACIMGRVNLRTLGIALRPLAAILAITVIAQMATLQQGTVLASIGSLAITQEALQATGVMFARLLGITAASIALMHLVPAHRLVEALSWMLAPLRRLGVRTEGFAVALQVALQTVPLLAESMASQAPAWKGKLLDGSFWRTVVPEFIARCYRTMD